MIFRFFFTNEDFIHFDLNINLKKLEILLYENNSVIKTKKRLKNV